MFVLDTVSVCLRTPSSDHDMVLMFAPNAASVCFRNSQQEWCTCVWPAWSAACGAYTMWHAPSGLLCLALAASSYACASLHFLHSVNLVQQ